MIEIKEKKDCCGCNACGDICPQDAIRFEADYEGFLYPKVDESKCVGCGLCRHVCPMLRVDDFKGNGYATPKSYVAAHKNLAIRFDSTSGGAFSALAKVVYSQKGFVGGAVRNADYSVSQFISDKRSDLTMLRSSKYEQSDARGFYRSVKQALKTGRPVLVCGTPCQMVALRAFIGEMPENLYISDFVCRGNNSPLAALKFREWLEARAGSKIVYFKHKNKELGWDRLTNKVVYSNGKVEYWPRDISPFNYCYLKTNAFCRPSCYECKFKCVPRFADVTLADCWLKGTRLDGPFGWNLGNSLILVNNEHGGHLFDSAKSAFHLQDIDWETARDGNPAIDKSLPPSLYPREEVFRVLREKGFQGLIDAFINKKKEQDPKTSIFRRVYHLAKAVRRRLLKICRFCGLSMTAYANLMQVNGWRNVFGKGSLLFLSKRTQLRNSGGRIVLGGHDVRIGDGQLANPPLDSYVVLRGGSLLEFKGKAHFTYGAAIEVHKNGHLTVGDGCGFNMGTTIVCAEKITIGDGVMAGRHVTIRDNNGGHYMNFPGYRNTRPVEIGDHVWLCEGCTIMAGVKIGTGAVVGAKAVVFSDVPANSLVLGNPAKVVQDNVQWKY